MYLVRDVHRNKMFVDKGMGNTLKHLELKIIFKKAIV